MIGCREFRLNPMRSLTRYVVGPVLTSTLLAGCVAQQADLARIQKDLELQISKIKEEKKALGAEVDEARAAITESQNLISAQKADMMKMRSDLAPLNQQIKLLREQDLTSLYGKYEVAEKKISDLQKDLQTSKQNLRADLDSVQSTVQTQGEELNTVKAQTTTLIQQVDETNVANAEQMTKFQGAFGEFKTALADLGQQVNQEAQRASAAENKVSTEMDQLVRNLRADLNKHQEELTSLQTHSTETSQTIVQLREASEGSGTLLGTQLDEQAKEIEGLKQQIAAQQEKLTADTAALRTYLENDVQTGLTQVTKTIDKKQQETLDRIQTLEQENRTTLEQVTQRANQQQAAIAKLSTTIDQHQQTALEQTEMIQKDIETLGTHVQADAAHMQELSQSVVKLREAQDVMGSLLGKRGDEIIQQAGRLSERMNTVEAHQSELTQQLQANTDTTSKHLAEVTANLTSVTQALEQTGQTLTERMTAQENTLKRLNKEMAEFQRLKKETEGQMQQMQSASELTTQLRQSLEQMSSRIQELEIHQSGLVGKLDSDAQTTTTHLEEVNRSITSVAQALEKASAKLNTRINDQEKRLNNALTNFEGVEGTADASERNLNHLNQLTETVNQLRSVVNTIGTKLGERVDEHEGRLGQLATRVNKLQGSRPKKK